MADNLKVEFLRARFADESMPWTRPHVESLINQIEELTKQRDEGWNNFYALRKRVAEEKYPGMTNVVSAHETKEYLARGTVASLDGLRADLSDIGAEKGNIRQTLHYAIWFAEKANEAPADEICVWECASCKHWTPVSHARCACCGRERAVKTSQAKALDEMVKASEDVGGYDLPATPRGESK